jgi:hypothetical protein
VTRNYKRRARDRIYLGAVVRTSPGKDLNESFPIAVSSPLNGGAGFAGTSGRKTANAGDTNAIQTSTNTVAHFMSAALSRIKRHRKQNFFAITVIKRKCRGCVIGQKTTQFEKDSFNHVTF